MSDSPKVQCPLCDGRGELQSSELVNRFTTPELRKRLDARVAEILQSVELVGVAHQSRDFQKEVHSWNPAVPIWNRSPKE